jgi:hypothetical protein
MSGDSKRITDKPEVIPSQRLAGHSGLLSPGKLGYRRSGLCLFHLYDYRIYRGIGRAV